MSYAGAITFDHLASAISTGFKPELRVFLQEITPAGLGGPAVRELLGFSNVSYSRAVGGKGRATITLANINDRYFANYTNRSFVASNNSTRSYLTNILNRALPYVRELNPERRHEYVRSFQGPNTFALPDRVSEYISYLYNFTALVGRINQDLEKNDVVAKKDFVDLGLMQRVYIDVKGQDGLWYAGFTGILTGIIDMYRPGDQPTITLQCSDLWRLFALSEINVQTGPSVFEDTVFFDAQSKTGQLFAPGQSTILDGLDGVEIIKRVLLFTQGALSYQAYNDLVAGARQSSSLALTRADFFQDERFWNVPAIYEPVNANYNGATTLRRVLGTSPGTGIQEGTKISDLVADYAVDINIQKGYQGEVYQRLISRILGFWQAQHITGDSLIKKVMDSTLYDVFLNGNGDLVYQVPRYNNLPGEYKPIVTSTTQTANNTTVDSTQDAANTADAIPIEQLSYGNFQAEGLYDYSPSKGSFATRFHGFNYLITDLGLRGWQFGSSEEALVTATRVPGGLDYFKDGVGKLNSYLLMGRVGLEDTCGIPQGTVRKLQQRFGVRVRESQQIFIPELFTGNSPQALLNAYALALMQQINATSSAGAVELHSRPDLDVGNNILMVERERLFYVTGIAQRYEQGKDVSTTLQLSFGHDVGEVVPIPFFQLKELILKIPVRPSPTPAVQAGLPEGGADPSIRTNPDGSATATVTVIGGGSTTLKIPSGRSGVEQVYGKFTYERVPNSARVIITDDFESRYIRDLDIILPKGNTRERIRVHVLAMPFFKAVFNHIYRDPALKNVSIKVLPAFKARMTWNSPTSNNLSFHSWGIAIDLIAGDETFKRGEASLPKNALLAVHFKKFGFTWGGNFSQGERDDMHFQLAFPTGGKEFVANVPAGEGE